MLSKPIKRKYEGREVEFFFDEFLQVWLKTRTIKEIIKDMPPINLEDINPQNWQIAQLNNFNVYTLISTIGIHILTQKGIITNYSFTTWISKQRCTINNLFTWLMDADGDDYFRTLHKESKELLADMMRLRVSDIWGSKKKKSQETVDIKQQRKTRLVKIKWNDLTVRVIAHKFDCSAPYVTYAIGNKYDSDLSRRINKFIDALPLPTTN